MGENLFNTFSFDLFKKHKKQVKQAKKQEAQKKIKVKELAQKLEARKETFKGKKNPTESADLSEILAEYERRKKETGNTVVKCFGD